MHEIPQVTRDVAPILVCAPHATLVDAIAILISRSVPLAKKALSGNFEDESLFSLVYNSIITKIIYAFFRSHISWGHRTVYASVICLEGTSSLPKGRGLANKGKIRQKQYYTVKKNILD